MSGHHSFEGDEDAKWFPSDGVQSRDVAQRVFEHELYRAIQVAKSAYKIPVIRCSEAVFTRYLQGEVHVIAAACWSVYMYRGLPVALRGNHEAIDVVEVLDETGGSSVVFRVEI